MIDREKVINGITHCFLVKDCDGCTYETACNDAIDNEGPDRKWHCPILDDVLALLKEQETEIRQLRLALDIAKGTCKGIRMEGR